MPSPFFSSVSWIFSGFLDVFFEALKGPEGRRNEASRSGAGDKLGEGEIDEPRRVIPVVIVLVIAAAGWAGWRKASGPATHDGPIVLISIDTLRADHLPAYGYTQVSTPAIDALAADGVVFESAWAHSPQTFPSHASILTGRLPFEHGVRDNLGGFTLKPGEATLAEERRTGGFVSAYVLRDGEGVGVRPLRRPPAALFTGGGDRRGAA